MSKSATFLQNQRAKPTTKKIVCEAVLGKVGRWPDLSRRSHRPRRAGLSARRSARGGARTATGRPSSTLSKVGALTCQRDHKSILTRVLHHVWCSGRPPSRLSLRPPCV